MRSMMTSALVPDLPSGGDQAAGHQAVDVPQAWLETTYLDENLRVCRDDAGGAFVLVKDVLV